MTTKLRVPDATCGHCKQTIETAISGLEGVSAVLLDLESKTLSVEHDETVQPEALTGVISAAGYTPEVAA
jgi:copper chaperone